MSKGVMPLAATGVECRDHALRSLDRLPPFSPILNRLLATSAREDVSFAALAELIEKDTVLAGNVLRLVNSALYNLRGTVNSVRHAVAILGVDRLRNVGLSFSVSRMWSQVRMPAGWSAARFNLHSVATAVLADLLAPQRGVPYPEGAFVAGLLHDIGKLLIAIALPQEYGAICAAFERGGRTLPDCEMDLIGTTHAELSGAALERWNLPEPIRRAVTFHHGPEEADSGRPHLAHVVLAADGMANQFGHSVLRTARGPAPEAAELPPQVMEQFEREFDALKGFF